MAVLRLRMCDRELLMRRAEEVVQCDPKLVGDVEDSYGAAIKAVLPIIQKKYPAKDMKVLQKYGEAKPCRRVDLADEKGNYSRLRLREEHQLLIPDRHSGCLTLLVETDVVHLANAYIAAEEHLDDDRNQRLNDYRAFIYGCRTFEQVVDVWPEAQMCFEHILKGRGGEVVSMEVIARVKADIARRTGKK